MVWHPGLCAGSSPPAVTGKEEVIFAFPGLASASHACIDSAGCRTLWLPPTSTTGGGEFNPRSETWVSLEEGGSVEVGSSFRRRASDMQRWFYLFSVSRGLAGHPRHLSQSSPPETTRHYHRDALPSPGPGNRHPRPTNNHRSSGTVPNVGA